MVQIACEDTAVQISNRRFMKFNIIYSFKELEDFINSQKPDNVFLRVFDELMKKSELMMTCDNTLLEWYSKGQGILFYHDGLIGGADETDSFKLLNIIPVLPNS